VVAIKRTPACVAFLLAAMLSAAASAQSAYPDHPVKIIAPFAAGGPSDLIGRILADKLTASLKQRVPASPSFDYRG
jgi:tripartite-type tricarboxylate transporter receptor subunit TctC